MELSLVVGAKESAEAATNNAEARDRNALEEAMEGALQTALEDEVDEVRDAAVGALVDLTWPDVNAPPRVSSVPWKARTPPLSACRVSDWPPMTPSSRRYQRSGVAPRCMDATAFCLFADML